MFGVDDPLDALAPAQRRALLAQAEHGVHPPGAVLVEQGSEPRSLFRVHSGFARVYCERLGSRVELARLVPGSWFGELSLLDGTPASATVVAESRIEVDRFSEVTIEKLLSGPPEVAVAFYRGLAIVLARRLRGMTEAIPEQLLERARSDVSFVDPTDLSTYLSPTKFCDLEHESIRAVAVKLADGIDDVAELARRAFYFVRDGIVYTAGLTPDCASETLARGSGSCSNKANLFVAILRAAGIPSGFHFMIVKAGYQGPTISGRWLRFMGKRSLHVFPAALLNGRWVRCDPSDDARLSDNIGHLNPPTRKIEFDGVQDAMLHLAPSSIEYYDATCWPDIDVVLAKDQRMPQIVVTALNRYIDFGRCFGLEYREATEISDAFLAWYRENHPSEYAEFEAVELRLARS